MIVVGTRFYPADEGGTRRQEGARRSILSLEHVVPVNLQFADESFAPDGFLTLPVLRRDSRLMISASGPRMPVIAEMLDRLADVARDRGCRYFLFANADIELTQDAVRWIVSGARDAYAFSRADLEPVTRRRIGMMTLGLDAFAFDVNWWERERRRFRPYVAGALWDNVYAAILCSHGRGQIVSDRQLVFHERHVSSWRPEGPFAAYNGFLAALDSPYFSRWAVYASRLQDAAAEGRTIDCDAVMRNVFSGPLLTPSGHARHAVRSALARIRYARIRRQT